MKSVAIVAFAANTRRKARWDAYDDYWSMNECYIKQPPDDNPMNVDTKTWTPFVQMDKITGWFQMHDPLIWRNPANKNDKDHYKWLKQRHPFPVFMQDVYDDVPSSAKFPREEMAKFFGPACMRELDEKRIPQSEFETCTVAWMIAYAIFMGYKRIGLYGVDMGSETEWAYQVPSVYFWLGVARGMGVEIVLPDSSKVFQGLTYGYEAEPVIHRQYIENRLTEIKVKKDLIMGIMNEIKGEMNSRIKMLESGNLSDDAEAEVKQALAGLEEDLDAAQAVGNFYIGIQMERENDINRLNMIPLKPDPMPIQMKKYLAGRFKEVGSAETKVDVDAVKRGGDGGVVPGEKDSARSAVLPKLRPGGRKGRHRGR